MKSLRWIAIGALLGYLSLHSLPDAAFAAVIVILAL